MEETKNLKDHRELGKELELFFFDETSPGSVFWLPKGMVIFKELEKFIRTTVDNRGYQEISTPIIAKSELFKKSGHWKFFKDNMFNFKVERESWSIKPMNCPESAIVYKFKTRSYKDLPLRFSELGRLHRNERSGTLNGLFRARQMVMDDAHIFCRLDQIQEEITDMLGIILDFYKKLGLPVKFGLATRPEKAMGDKRAWEKAENQLSQALKLHNIDFETLKGEGAFYGPKIHVDFTDNLGRVWTMATIQVDFQMPRSLELEYISENGKSLRPVMLHRAVFGSFERFIGILTEHYQGTFPVWLSPVQAVVMPITDRNKEYAQSVFEKLKKLDIRVHLDNRSETLQAKIRDAQIQKIPYMLIVGDKEEKNGEVSLRLRTSEDLGSINPEAIIEKIRRTIEEKKDL